MKFLTKINRNYLFLFVLILLTVSTAGYLVLKMIIMEDAKESLLEKEIHIVEQIKDSGGLPNIFPIVEVRLIPRQTNARPVFREVYIEDELEHETEAYLEYANELKIGDSWYSIQIRQATFESEDLVLVLSLLLFILLLSAFGISFFITKKMNNTVWADFEKNLTEIESFSFIENKTLTLEKSNIEEFERLNKVIDALTKKLTSDYFSLKQFTENASHEIQTPLAIALLNLEEILQQDLSEEVFANVVAAINAIKKLSQLNQSLILLTKIENRQFSSDKEVVLNEIFSRKIEEYSGLFGLKRLEVKMINNAGFKVRMHEQLADILAGNLLSNAINHNVVDGTIAVEFDENKLRLCNTGMPNTLTSENIFDRFTKGNSKSFGLGLAMVKQICETHKLEIKYQLSYDSLHCFVIERYGK